MRVLFIYPDICAASGRFQQGIGHISSILKAAGHRTFLIHLHREESKECINNKIATIKPDIVAFSITTNPGTRLYEICEKAGFLTSARKNSYFEEGSMLNLPTRSNKQITNYFQTLHQMSIEKIIHDRHQRLYPFYKLTKAILGNSISYNISIKARRILYHY